MKRFLALTLALALMLSLAPSVFAASTDWEWAREAKSFVYSFGSEAHTSSTGKDVQAFRTVSQTIDNVAEGYQKWGFVNFRGENAYSRKGGYTEYLPYVNENGPVYDPGEAMTGKLTGTIWRNAFAVELDIEESGTYNASLDFKTYQYAPIVDVYLIEKPTANWADNTEFYYNLMGVSGRTGLPSSARIGKNINFYASTSSMKSIELMPVTLDSSKNYYLIIVPVGMHDTPLNHVKNNLNGYGRFADARVWLYNFTLSQRLPQDAEMLSYKLQHASMNSNFPTVADYTTVVNTGGKWKGYSRVYNLDFFDWEKKTKIISDGADGVKEGENEYYSLDLTKTAPFKVDSRSSNITVPYVDTAYTTRMTYAKYTDSLSTRPHVALRLNVPYAGRYQLEVVQVSGNGDSGSRAFTKVYFGKAADTYNATDIQSKIDSGDYEHLGWYNYWEGSFKKSATSTADENKVSYFTVDVPAAGEYHLLFDTCAESRNFNTGVDSSNGQWFRLGQVNLTPVPGVLSEAEVKVQTIANTMTADIAVESADAAPTAATVNVLTRDIEGNADASAVVTTISGNVGSNLTATAPEKDGYEFLYWEKGIGNNRRVVSYEPEYSFKAVSGGMWLTAVYRNTSSEALPVIFYNATGDELSRALYNSGDEVEVPSVPAFENYTFIGWKCAETGDSYASGDAIKAEGKQMRIVAQYEDVQTPSIVINVTGGTGAGTYTYGDTVTVSATEREGGNGSKVFCYWTKNGETVSFGKSYTFRATESSNLVAVYEDYKPSVTQELRRIIVSGNFAEFIGLDNASEKGILFNENGGDATFANATHKIAMTGDGNELKFENDLGNNSTMTGYAIVDGKVIYSK
ncbi:MAG: hypothetical protein E7473_02270 [Ruminococcaceae bacterium]|nr:hypothetical protein [Oscillospiraceae bacterium]